MKITGRIFKIGEVDQINSSFKKQMIYVETEEQYPQQVGIQFDNNRIDLLSNLKIGDRATILVNVRGKFYNDKNITYLQGWKVEM